MNQNLEPGQAVKIKQTGKYAYVYGNYPEGAGLCVEGYYDTEADVITPLEDLDPEPIMYVGTTTKRIEKGVNLELRIYQCLECHAYIATGNYNRDEKDHVEVTCYNCGQKSTIPTYY